MPFNTLDPQLVQSLPLDISRYILETAALLHRPTAMNLVLVSKEFHSWITPILYRTIILNKSDEVWLSFGQSIRRRGLAEFYHTNVKTLCISPEYPPFTESEYEDKRLVISTCTGVVNLALWVYIPDTLTPFFTSGKISSRPKYMSFFHLPPNDVSYVLPPSLTVLDFQLHDGDLSWMKSTWDTLFSLCPNLTTLILHDDYAESPEFIAEMVSSALSSPRDSLQSIILRPRTFELRYGAFLYRLKDSRIVFVPPSHIPNPTIEYIEKGYPGKVFFLPEVTESGTDEHQLADWTFPTPAPYVETLWERVERWKEEGRCPTTLEYVITLTV